MYTSTYGGYLPHFWHERWIGELGLVGKAWGNMPDDLNPLIDVCWNIKSPMSNLLTPFPTAENPRYERPMVRTGAPFILCQSDLTGFRCDQGAFVSYMGLAKYGWWHRVTDAWGGNIMATDKPSFMSVQIQEVEDTSRSILLAETEPGSWQFANCGCRWRTYSDPWEVVQRHYGGGHILHFDGHVRLVKGEDDRMIEYWEGEDYDDLQPGW